jgi:hypothetical protein
MWPIRRSKRAPVDSRHRHVRPALEVLEGRVVPASGANPFAGLSGAAAQFDGGAAFANRMIMGAGDSSVQHVAVDAALIKGAQDSLSFVQAQLQSGNRLDLVTLILLTNTEFFDLGILSVAVPDLFANMSQPTGFGGGGLGGFGGGGFAPGGGFGLGGGFGFGGVGPGGFSGG